MVFSVRDIVFLQTVILQTGTQSLIFIRQLWKSASIRVFQLLEKKYV